jgi:pimeloyl-ACP methyl ester carboxylesterase
MTLFANKGRVSAFFTQPRTILVLLCWLLVATATAQTAPAKPAYGSNEQVGKHFPVNGIKLYYEVYGTGAPLLLLHGNGGSIAGHSQRIEYFKSKYRVIVVDSRGHGKSKDDTSVLTYEQMANDIAKLLDHLHVDSCYVWGQSDGGILGLILAKDYPKKVKRLAVSGANLQPDSSAVQPAIVAMVQDSARLASKPKAKQLYVLLATQPHIPLTALAAIRVPVLVISGDRDAIRLEYTFQLFSHLPHANLFVMPGASHFGVYEKPNLFLSVLSDFFEKPFIARTTAEIMGIK